MKTYSITDVGMVRKVNQDYVFCYENPVGNLPNLFVVADGMGGHQAGDYASRCCVENIATSVKNGKAKSPISVMEEAINEANLSVFRQAESNPDLYGMGTTLVATTIVGKEMYIANIGDSRAYIIHKDQIKQITEEHSWVQEMIRNGQLESKEARSHKNKNVITRAIGTSAMVQADYFELTVTEGDILLMCTDGLTNMLEDEDILDIIQEKDTVEAMGKELIRAANANGGKDNIGIVLVQI